MTSVWDSQVTASPSCSYCWPRPPKGHLGSTLPFWSFAWSSTILLQWNPYTAGAASSWSYCQLLSSSWSKLHRSPYLASAISQFQTRRCQHRPPHSLCGTWRPARSGGWLRSVFSIFACLLEDANLWQEWPLLGTALRGFYLYRSELWSKWGRPLGLLGSLPLLAGTSRDGNRRGHAWGSLGRWSSSCFNLQ